MIWNGNQNISKINMIYISGIYYVNPSGLFSIYFQVNTSIYKYNIIIFIFFFISFKFFQFEFILDFFFFSFMLNCINSFNLLDNQRSYENPFGIIYIFNCIFSRSTVYSFNGGIIYVNQIFCQLTIDQCLFFNCTSNAYSGAVYFSSDIDNSQVNIIKCCGHKCSGRDFDHGHFAYIFVKNNNNINLVSINQSPFSNNPGSDVLYLINGNQSIINLNSSFNDGRTKTGFTSSNALKLNSIFGNFYNDHSRLFTVIWFQGSNSEDSLKFSNLINSSSPSYGIIWISNNGIHSFISCIFYNNLNYLFDIETGSLNLINCKISHDNSKLFTHNLFNNISNIITSNYYFKPFNNNYFYTYLCNSNFFLNNFKKKKLNFLIFINLIIFN